MQKKTRAYLDRYFTSLKRRGVIKYYKIRNSFLP
jgi:hypothetical protein